MKKLIVVLGVVLIVVSTTFYACKDHTTPSTPGMTLVSLTSGGVNLLGRNFGDTIHSVSITDNIVATFSNDIDFRTVLDTNIHLTRGKTNIRMNFIIEGKTLTIDPSITLLAGTNLVLEFASGKIMSTKGEAFSGRSVNIETEGVGVDTPPRSIDQILYVQFNGGVSDVTGHDTLVASSIGYTIDRFGIANEAGNFLGGTASGPIAVLKGDTLITPSITISTWINISVIALTNTDQLTYGVFGYAGANGYYFEIGRPDTLSGPTYVTWGTNHKLDTGYVLSADSYYPSGTIIDPNPVVFRDGWHHLALTYDEATLHKSLYIDGEKKYDLDLGAVRDKDIDGLALKPLDTARFKVPQISLGYYVDKVYTGSTNYIWVSAFNTFHGALDDFRIYKVALTQAEINKLYLMELGNSK